ncbi:Immunoglobulin I-set [Trinorchestia longiramus]|nr:Immunoglobulin I-set [Trinorchestia longiramus]
MNTSSLIPPGDVPPLDTPSTTVTVASGQAAVLALPPLDMHPRPSVDWQSEDLALLYGIKYATTDPLNQLVILDAAPDDQKLYRAVLTNAQLGQEVSTGWTQLTVVGGVGEELVPLSIVVPPSNITVTKGSNIATLQCIANARPLYQVETVWRKDGVPIEESGLAFSLVGLWNRTLSLLQVDRRYSGNYSCHVALRGAMAEPVVAAATLTVLEAPTLKSQPSIETLGDLGKTLTLECPAVGQPHPSVMWLRDAEPLDILPGSRYQLLRNGSLAVGSVALNDSAMFQCRASNAAGEVSAYTWLRVKTSAPVLLTAPANVTVVDGGSAALSCGAGGAPHPNISWTHPDGSEIISDGSRYRVTSDGSLRISNVRSRDRGRYSCSRANEAGQVAADAWINILEKTHIVTPPQDTRVILGHVATLPCGVRHADGVAAVVTWQHDGVAVAGMGGGNSRFTMLGDGSLQIQEARAADVGLYQCTVISEGGNDTSSARLEVMELPYPPGTVTAERNQPVPKSVLLSWSPGFDGNSRLTGYILQRREVPVSGVSTAAGDFGLKWETFSRNVTATALSTVVTNLRPSTGYQFRVAAVNHTQHSYLISGLITWKDYEVQVAAYNVKGVGVYSEGVRLKTKEGVPTAPPRQVTVEARMSTVVEVTWKPPEPWMINGINQGYKVQAWLEDPTKVRTAEPAKTVTVPPSPYQDVREAANLTGLLKYREYRVTVLCFTAPGDGNRSLPLSVTTLEDVPGPPNKVHFPDVSDRSVLMRWSAPEHQNGILTGYSVAYRQRDLPRQQPNLVANLTADVTSYRIHNLTASTFYTFSVWAWTSKGPGEAAVSSLQSGVEPELPDSPTHLAVSNIQPHSVVLQFTPGFDGNASIDLWIVQALSSRSSTWETLYNTSAPTATTLSVPHLVPFTTYQLRLIARNVVGDSPPSPPSPQFQTLQAAPAHPPSNVTVRAVSATELRVRWIPLQQWEWYGASQGYRILYRPLGCACEYQHNFVYDTTANSHKLEQLHEYTKYQITMEAVNDVGASTRAKAAVERTREAVPSAGPSNVTAEATSSTTVVVRWSAVDQLHQNGVILGYKVIYAGVKLPTQEKLLLGNTTQAATLTQLRKYHHYSVQVLAYTRLGDGVPAPTPSLAVITFDDVPGVPSSVSFPDVSFTYARIIWDVPEEPNGEITAYSISYHLADDPSRNLTVELGPNDRTFKAENLKPESYYMFLARARTRLGWGKVLRAPVYTTNNRQLPTPPSVPTISHSQLASDSVTFSWNPGLDGLAPIRYYTVQVSEENGGWTDIPEQVEYSSTSYTAHSLSPFTSYRFRLQSTNDIGPSGWSPVSEEVRTLPAAPTTPPQDVKVIPITTDSVRVEWSPVFPDAWSGDTVTAGYRVRFRQQLTDDTGGLSVFGQLQSRELQDPEGTSLVLQGLQRDSNYEIEVVSYNGQGDSAPSPPVTVYVGEAVPTGHPLRVTVQPVSSTEIRITWEPPADDDLNGELLGYKVFYRQSSEPEGLDEIEVVSADTTAHELLYLDTYVEYVITILCFNPAGDGPKSDPVKARTMPDIPGPVASLNFTDITMNSLRLVWEKPQMPNGQIVGYLVTYETAAVDESFSKQVKQKVVGEQLPVSGLEEEVTYLFTVRAQTIGYGPKVSANVTTGPQPGSPARPRDVTLSRTVSSVTLHWRNAHHGAMPLLGYYIEARTTASHLSTFYLNSLKWEVLMKTESGEAEEYTISFQNLLPSTRYTFRVIAYNKFGISYPALAPDEIVTPSKVYLETGYLQAAPFYHQTWFMVTLAAVSIVLIIIVIATLCVKSKTYKYKRVVEELLAQEAQNKSLEESLGCDETNFSTFELRPTGTMSSAHHVGTLGKRSTMPRSTLGRSTLGSRSTTSRRTGPLSIAGPSGAAAAVVGKAPPRPAPASLAYSDDETLKSGNGAATDSSDVTEKPSDISSSESHESELSDVESEQHSEPASFVNHYANVNDTLRQSWKRQKPTTLRNYSSYTDSEAEGSAVMSLNGGQIIMNNMAGSRAPLPGFSSFV